MVKYGQKRDETVRDRRALNKGYVPIAPAIPQSGHDQGVRRNWLLTDPLHTHSRYVPDGEGPSFPYTERHGYANPSFIHREPHHHTEPSIEQGPEQLSRRFIPHPSSQLKAGSSTYELGPQQRVRSYRGPSMHPLGASQEPLLPISAPLHGLESAYGRETAKEFLSRRKEPIEIGSSASMGTANNIHGRRHASNVYLLLNTQTNTNSCPTSQKHSHAGQPTVPIGQNGMNKGSSTYSARTLMYLTGTDNTSAAMDRRLTQNIPSNRIEGDRVESLNVATAARSYNLPEPETGVIDQANDGTEIFSAAVHPKLVVNEERETRIAGHIHPRAVFLEQLKTKDPCPILPQTVLTGQRNDVALMRSAPSYPKTPFTDGSKRGSVFSTAQVYPKDANIQIKSIDKDANQCTSVEGSDNAFNKTVSHPGKHARVFSSNGNSQTAKKTLGSNAYLQDLSLSQDIPTLRRKRKYKICSTQPPKRRNPPSAANRSTQPVESIAGSLPQAAAPSRHEEAHNDGNTSLRKAGPFHSVRASDKQQLHRGIARTIGSTAIKTEPITAEPIVPMEVLPANLCVPRRLPYPRPIESNPAVPLEEFMDDDAAETSISRRFGEVKNGYVSHCRSGWVMHPSFYDPEFPLCPMHWICRHSRDCHEIRRRMACFACVKQGISFRESEYIWGVSRSCIQRNTSAYDGKISLSFLLTPGK